MNSLARRVNIVVWGTPWRPWWTYSGRARLWRRALTLALAALTTGCTAVDYVRIKREEKKHPIEQQLSATPIPCDANNCGKVPQ